MSGIIYVPAQRNRQPSRPTPRPRPPPHQGKATPCPVWHLPAIWNHLHIEDSYGFSSATWTLSLRNLLWTCITQVHSTFTTYALYQTVTFSMTLVALDGHCSDILTVITLYTQLVRSLLAIAKFLVLLDIVHSDQQCQVTGECSILQLLDCHRVCCSSVSCEWPPARHLCLP